MKKLFSSLRLLPFALGSIFGASLMLTSCLDDESLSEDNTYMGNFRSCWRALDEHYCYFDYKNINWDEVYDRYAPYFSDSIHSKIEAFQLLYQMLGELHDGHVNLYSSFNVARNWSWYQDYPQNFDANLLERYYLGTRYWIAGGLSYTMLSDTIGYVRYASFSNAVSENNLDYVLGLLGNCKGLIFDVRDNGGGNLTNVETITRRFCQEFPHTYGYICHKTGPGHNEFSSLQELTLDKSGKGFKNSIRWNASRQPVVVLTNRLCYSATNTFVMAMKSLDGLPATDTTGVTAPMMIKTMGDHTGGGGGLPFESTLPNGWVVRFSTSPMFDMQNNHIENGFAPDFTVQMDSLHAYRDHHDDIIESARLYINRNTKMTYKSSRGGK